MRSHRYFPKIFQPGQIGKLKIKNRIVMLPAVQFASANGEVTDRTIEHFTEIARGGAGLIIVGLVSPFGFIIPNPLILDSDRFIFGHYRLTEAVHAYGAKIGAQLNHLGRWQPVSSLEGRQPVSSSPVPCMLLGEYPLPVPRAMERQEIYEFIDKFAEAAERAYRAGYDLIQIQGGAGSLLNQFISPYLNKRTDEFGGSLENRMRFPLAVIRAIKDTVGRDFPLSFRLCAEEFVEGGISIKDSPTIAKILEEACIDEINIVTGISETFNRYLDMMRLEEGWRLDLWEAIKKVVTVPVSVCGGLTHPEFCEKILAEKRADFIGLAGALLADPDWPVKASEGKVEDIRMCISCRECIGRSRRRGWGAACDVKCSVNASVGREREFARIKPAMTKKKVMIIGGGVAGMEAARVAALRGHKVVIYEKSKQLGGQIRIAGKAPGKEKILWFNDYLTTQLRKLEVPIESGVDVSIEVIDAVKPDVVIVATGAEPFIPHIPGIEGENMVTAWDVLSGMIEVANREIIVIGGGMVGCETAEFMAKRGNKVTVVEMKPMMASDMEPNNRAGLMESLRDAKVNMLTDTEIVEIKRDGVIGKSRESGKQHIIKGDLVVLAVGAKPQRDLADALEEKGIEVHTTGDCNEPRGIMNAVYEGSLVARNI